MEPRDLSTHTVYRAGRGVEETARELGMAPEDLVKLSSNENPFGPSPAAIDAVREHAPRMSSYPKASHMDLTAAIADEWGLGDEQVWLAPSGDAALDYLARAFIDPGHRVLAPEPGFAYYPMSARYHHAEVDTYRLAQATDFAQSPDTILDAYDGQRIVYLTSPHNPTGSELTLEDVRAIADETDDETLVVLDEAYGHFSETPWGVALLAERDDVALVHTFSKAYGLAGMRVGYALTPAEWADAYARVNTPFGVTELSCRAALAALEEDAHVEQTVETIRWAREYMYANLSARTWESGGNFVLVAVGDASAVTEAAKRRGVLVRDCTSFGLPSCIRITCGTRAETRQAVETINEVLAEVSA